MTWADTRPVWAAESPIDRRRERAFALDRALSALAGPLTLKPLEILVAAYAMARTDAATESALRDELQAEQRTTRMFGRRFQRIAHLSATQLAAELEQRDQEIRELKRSISKSAPALEKWRRSVLDAGRRRTPLERAAAWELTALECERRGLAEQARHAREHARTILLSTPSRVA